MKTLPLLIASFLLVACDPAESTKNDFSTKNDKGVQVSPKEAVKEHEPRQDSKERILTKEEQLSAQQQPLKVLVKDLLSETATVDIRVYNTAEGFLQDGGAIATYRFKPKNGVAELFIEDLKYGVYAMAIYQDLDESGKIGKNLVGIPNEPFAVSNDVKPGLGAPPFEACSFNYSEKEFEVVVHLLDGVL